VGSWGVGLYDNDAARDLKAGFAELVRLPIGQDELLEKVLDAFPAGRDPEDEDHTGSWLALADLFHAYGLDHPEVFARALEIVETGADLAALGALEMSDANLRKRARVLDKLAEKWRAPNPKPRGRRLVKTPEPLLFESGDALAYPTQKGNAASAYLPAARLGEAFRADGWGAFIVLATARRHAYLACYLVARLYLKTAGKPTLEDCAGAVIAGIDPRIPFIPADPAVKVVSVTRAEARKLAVEKIGSCELDQRALRAAFPDPYLSLDQPSWSLVGLLRPYSEDKVIVTERSVPLKKLPLSRFLHGR
jgi:hypothetical protein